MPSTRSRVLPAHGGRRGRDRAAAAAAPPEGALADMAASDPGSGSPAGSCTRRRPQGATFVVCLFDAGSSELVAVIEADQLGQPADGCCERRRGAPSREERTRARSACIGCGHQAETQVACIRAARAFASSAWSPTAARRRSSRRSASERARAGREPSRGGASRTSSSRSRARAIPVAARRMARSRARS